MSSQTIINVPVWARSVVAQYANTAWNLSQEQENSPLVLITSGFGAAGQAVLDSAGTVVGVNVTDGGNYYSDVPSVSIIGGGGANATAHAVLTSGVVTSIVVDVAGTGYTSLPTVSIIPIGSGATATATLSGGSVSAITVTAGGSGYTDEPTVVVYGGGGSGAIATSSLTSDAVSSITLTSGGYGYGTGTTPLFSAYAGVIIAPQDDNELNGIEALATRGQQGNETIRQATAFANGIINEDHLAGLPVALTGKIGTKAAAAFVQVQALIGRKSLYQDTGATIAADLTATTALTYVARLNAKLEGDNYKAERASQDVAMGLAIDLAKQAAIDAEAWRKAGLYMREYTQSTYELTHKLFLEQQELSVFSLEIFGNCLRALTGSQQSTVGDVSGASPLMQAVGIATVTAGVYSALSTSGALAAGGTALFDMLAAVGPEAMFFAS